MPTPTARRARLRDYLELVRVPNVFTAPADSMMGFWFVRAADGLGGAAVLGTLAASSALLYASGIVLNDLFDLETDRRQRPERPLPSGRVAPAAAAWLGAELMIVGLAGAFLVGFLADTLAPGMVAIVLAGCILCYDAWAKRTPIGPAVMGACRGLNVLMGMAVVWPGWQAQHLLVSGGIALYVAGLTWFARSETVRSRRAALLWAMGVMVGGMAMLGVLPWVSGDLAVLAYQRRELWALAVAVLGLFILRRFFLAIVEPSPARVQTAVRNGILSLVILDAMVVAAARGLGPAVVVLGLLVPAVGLSRWFSPT